MVRLMVASDKNQEAHPLLLRLWESHVSFPVLSFQWELLAMGLGLSALRTGSQGHRRRDIILHHSGRKGEDERRGKEPSVTES